MTSNKKQSNIILKNCVYKMSTPAIIYGSLEQKSLKDWYKQFKIVDLDEFAKKAEQEFIEDLKKNCSKERFLEELKNLKEDSCDDGWTNEDWYSEYYDEEENPEDYDKFLDFLKEYGMGVARPSYDFAEEVRIGKEIDVDEPDDRNSVKLFCNKYGLGNLAVYAGFIDQN